MKKKITHRREWYFQYLLKDHCCTYHNMFTHYFSIPYREVEVPQIAEVKGQEVMGQEVMVLEVMEGVRDLQDKKGA